MEPTMKKHTSLILFALFGAVAAYGQSTTATTIPVGYVSQGDAGGTLKDNTDYRLSIPLERSTKFTGTVSAVTSNTITVTGAAFTTNQWTAIPHYVRITSGAKAGFLTVIDSHDATTLTVTAPQGQSLTGVLSGDKLSIQEAWTVGNFFENITVPVGLEVHAFSGGTGGINIADDLNYTYYGVVDGWLDGNGDPATSAVLYPGESFYVRNASGGDVTGFTVTGQVPVAPFTVVFHNVDPASSGNSQDIPFGIFSPVAQTVSALGLSSIAQEGDSILIFDLSQTGLNLANVSDLTYYAGDGWVDSGTGDPINPGTFTLSASGLGYIYRRVPSDTDAVWTFTPSYVPGLGL